ncbi:MAG TPA: twin-arginine translocase subunit TatC [Ferruginibacter sp.]|nr:twin-arginine translocase subunit TatC [Ferruginibacter sp.]HRO06972.1 twin-arginine translocase subunit TatC [Ferruginibacter sp.]HRO95422.1 twin-arginine translocase subunit TatC [Ferruginibacter sp.]HRP50502.1 twin-arginine translocase subunit TatC [Ferruginibacter sp.]
MAQSAARKQFLRSFRSKYDEESAEMSFADHLEALRWHLVRAVIAWLLATIFTFVFIDWIFDRIIYAPAHSDFITYRVLCDFSYWAGLGDSLCMPPVEIKLQGNTISGPFMSAISIAMIGGLIIAFPVLFWELWKFVKPALSPKEIQYSRGSIFWVTFCFILGGSFGYFLLAPFTFNFLANFTLGTTGAYTYIPTLDDYISTINNIILGCGLAFELPVLTYVLAKIGIITGTFLKSTRRYSFVIILVLAAIITPSPDWTSQAIVAIPLLLLMEISILIASRIERQKVKEEKEWS